MIYKTLHRNQSEQRELNSGASEEWVVSS